MEKMTKTEIKNLFEKKFRNVNLVNEIDIIENNPDDVSDLTTEMWEFMLTDWEINLKFIDNKGNRIYSMNYGRVINKKYCVFNFDDSNNIPSQFAFSEEQYILFDYSIN